MNFLEFTNFDGLYVLVLVLVVIAALVYWAAFARRSVSWRLGWQKDNVAWILQLGLWFTVLGALTIATTLFPLLGMWSLAVAAVIGVAVGVLLLHAARHLS